MTLAVETGAITLILEIMRVNKESMFFQNSTELLQTMAYFRGEGLVQLGVHDIIYEGMAMMLEDTLVQTCGMRVLHTLLANYFASTSKFWIFLFIAKNTRNRQNTRI